MRTAPRPFRALMTILSLLAARGQPPRLRHPPRRGRCRGSARRRGLFLLAPSPTPPRTCNSHDRRCDQRQLFFAPRGTSRLALLLSLSLLTACATRRPDPGAESAITRATGAPVVFRIQGAPLDEPAPAPDHLALAEALERAIATDPGLQAALARVRIAMADADQARLLPNPVLTLLVKFPEGGGSVGIEASLTADLLHAIQTSRRASAADHRMRESAAQSLTLALDVAAEVQERYAAAQAMDALLPLLRERLSLVQRLTDTARARLEAGEGTRTDVTILGAQRVELEIQIAAADLERRQERLRLARLIGQPSSAAGWTLEPWSPPVMPAEPEPRWVTAALAARPEVQAVAWRLAALGDDAALARLLPWDGAEAGVEAERDGDWSVGPTVAAPIPIFDTGRARRARVTAEQIEARHELTLAQRQVVEEVRVAYEALAAGRANLDRIRTQLVPLQQQRRQVTEDVYLVERDITPLLLAEQDLRTAQAAAIDAERQAIVALIRLQRAVGGRAPDSLADPAPPGPPQAQSESPALATDSRRSAP